MNHPAVVSADSHVVEPGDLWLNYIDPKYREQAPRYVRENGIDLFVTAETKGTPLVGTLGTVGKPAAEVRREGRHEEGRPGGWDPAARIPDMDLDGIDVEILYPSFGISVMRLEDLDYGRACRDAYHRWLADFCAYAPDRLKGVGMVDIDHVESAVEELQAFPDLGFVAVMMEIHSYDDRPLSERYFDPFWAAVQEIGLPISLHIGSERRAPRTRPPTPIESVLLKVPIQRGMAELILGGVLDRFPDLRIASVENDASWVAAFYERMDEKFTKYTGIQRYECKELPSTYGRRNFWHTFITDHPAITARRHIGVDRLMWSSDYPHFDGTWPRSREHIEDHLGGIPAEERALIQGGNALRLYHLA